MKLFLLILVTWQSPEGGAEEWIVDEGLTWEDCKAKAATQQNTLESGQSVYCEPE